MNSRRLMIASMSACYEERPRPRTSGRRRAERPPATDPTELSSDCAHTSNAGVLAAKKATSTIPIVFSIGADPVKLGIVSSLNRPSGNLTGIYQFTTGLEGKRLGLLYEMVPKATTLSVLIHPNFAPAESQLRDVQEAATRLNVNLVVVRANAESEFDAAFSSAAQQRAEAILVCASPFFNIRRRQLVLLAARHRLPAIYEWREFAEAGGLMSYGTRLADAYRQAGVYAVECDQATVGDGDAVGIAR
jgi:putative tryptophan/tyrosine transport system substrate-binding protein